MEATLRLGTDIAALGRLYPWLEAEADARQVPQAARQAMHVAVEEAVTNVAMHGFDAGEGGDIVIRLAAEPAAVRIVIEDSGRPFDPSAAPPPRRVARLEEADVGGRGLRLLHHYCRDIRYERVGGQNRLTLRFPLAA